MAAFRQVVNSGFQFTVAPKTPLTVESDHDDKIFKFTRLYYLYDYTLERVSRLRM